jgi:3-hydroxyacyl-CoA dehydrogenase / enoyl-CoA hydratase / 3-hydroxybutyryl-CoA epimerase / enoyl-CoA isomerase
VFQGKCIRVTPLEQAGLYELCFDRQGESINKFDDQTVEELRQATQALRVLPNLKGVLATSAKDVFIVGADITEFGRKFLLPAEQITADVLRSNEVFTAFEDLLVPTVVAINGFALGGGLEFALACTVRVMSLNAQVGVPEVKLGLFPGFGGTVRLVRVAGPSVASSWVATGKPASAKDALEAGIVDDVTAPEQLRERALDWLIRAASGELDLSSRRERKCNGIRMDKQEAASHFSTARVAAQKVAAPHQPAAIAAIDMMERGAFLDRNAALMLEAIEFGRIARTQAASSMVQTFLNEQAVKRSARQTAKGAAPVRSAAVLGAGIMGGGIAFASAVRDIPVRVRDIRGEALKQATEEAAKQVAKQVKIGRLTEARGAEVLRKINTQLDFEGFESCDFVIEAIVENLEIKRQVLADLELCLAPSAILASNTSSLRIDDIATCLQDPKRLVGMHFFNPVPQMPLVEIVRGKHTSDEAVATAVAFASSMGKTPIVVRDCSGFLVNRLLTAYMRGFLQLVNDGADFNAIDDAMEKFGWPMGPAYLEDVVGIDTGSHVNDVISAGYPDRMPHLDDDALRLMKRLGRYGQKTEIGFYRYERNAQGKPVRSAANDTAALLKQIQPNGPREFSDEEIVDRMMLPMVLEAAQALEEGVVASAAELDMAMTMGLGFPGYAGGPLKYADWLGLPEVLKRCERLGHLGKAYQPGASLRALAAANSRFH